ncbi:hypothetical protein H5410_015184 [Solanum commersonii]|uniref:Uncharacterized protein n=1 Tax=Solanum commersonii TaxID=4109 RepID=A0A9J5ZT49_SOLCO|nr:hypothetical protein H5410_015184 [Solanum commersonii]
MESTDSQILNYLEFEVNPTSLNSYNFHILHKMHKINKSFEANDVEMGSTNLQIVNYYQV